MPMKDGILIGSTETKVTKYSMIESIDVMCVRS